MLVEVGILPDALVGANSGCRDRGNTIHVRSNGMQQEQEADAVGSGTIKTLKWNPVVLLIWL